MSHRAGPRSSTAAATLEQVGEMKEYIEQALANIAYSITHATQKVDTSLTAIFVFWSIPLADAPL